MPEMNGRELAEKAALIRPTTKVLYMSGYTDDAIVRHGILDEKMPFLQKPFLVEALALKTREVLDQPPS
jgi:YesN/AraC family two-component response regulator